MAAAAAAAAAGLESVVSLESTALRFVVGAVAVLTVAVALFVQAPGATEAVVAAAGRRLGFEAAALLLCLGA